MGWTTAVRNGAAAVLIVVLGACGGGGVGDSVFEKTENLPPEFDPRIDDRGNARSSFFDLFTNVDDPNTTVAVNKYIWNASLDVLNFMPVQSVDPFTGVITMGYGTPPGGGRAYRATVYVRDPALDARSLTVALQSRGGTVNADTQRAVEDAILTRARQLRIQDGKL
ncbi:DUF3576 domain-containing protein [Alphaproteobacteria bacterium KMM 3653]|uniref:DUF3576 domain-containing protein n=1 Tax=Harenicola maris TaxID=2841044 RepID=A0AAP2CUC8_9RHOB|nr:DUF3576 domain-containing protein [Harenicola maris]